MYHKVGQPVTCKADRFLNIAATDFERQMRLLTSLGYRGRPFFEIADAVRCRKSLPRRTFAVTFDDGYCNVGEFAAPILKDLQIPATVFVVSQGAGKTNIWDRCEGHIELGLMRWEELCELSSDGWEIGGHTRTHPHLDVMDDEDALLEIVRGKVETETMLGIELKTFCYPFGHYKHCTAHLVEQAGFIGACTTKSGIADTTSPSPFLIPRVKVAYRDGAFGLLYRLLVRPHLPDFRKKRRDLRH